MQTEHDYILDHMGLDNWQEEWGNGDVLRNIVVEYTVARDATHNEPVEFDFCVTLDGVDVTDTLNGANREAFESLMRKEYYDRKY